jgi:SAM-dependent MidA family methyltransferase
MHLANLIREEIAAAGPISLARFMALALYHPDHGYYAQPKRPIGRRGDFFTSVSVGPMFGRLLANRFAGWLEVLGPGRLEVVEAGAHDGQLAADILSALDANHPALTKRLTYTILEPLTNRRSCQTATLERWRGQVRWFGDWAQATSPVRGVIFGNELLDAMPVHRWTWDAGNRVWRETGVSVRQEEFTWTALADAATHAAQPTLPDELRATVPDGYITETNPAAVAWWTTAAQHLERGWLVAIDYGDDDAARWAPGRTNGTFRGYHAHRATVNPLANPGSQDLTTQVDFATIRRAGEQAGLRTASLQSQEQFLADILKELIRAGGSDSESRSWNWEAQSSRSPLIGFHGQLQSHSPRDQESAVSGNPTVPRLPGEAPTLSEPSCPATTEMALTPAERRQITTLLHPQFLGRAFQVLVQHR